MKKIFSALFLLSILVISCAEEKAITVDRFKDFPEEIDGCACYFSANKEDFINGSYIYADTYHDHAYISINGQMMQFKLKSYTDVTEGYWVKIYTNDDYEVTLDSEEVLQVDETWQQKGTMSIKSKDGKSVKETIYGECGC
ncbi:hypothetical protein ACX0HA_14205 [Flavobacterium hauense]